jgi:hypothetical protein
MKTILESLQKKVIGVFEKTTETKIRVQKYVKFSYWMTYITIERGKKYDYFVLPGQTGGSLTFYTIQFKKLTEEEVDFIYNNWNFFNIIYKVKPFYTSEKGVWFDSPEGQIILIDENVNGQFYWSH